MMRYTILAGIALAAATPAAAVTLAPGTTTTLPGTTSAARPELAGPVIDLVQAFSYQGNSGLVTGSVQSRVNRSNLDGTYIFSWRVIVNSGSANAVDYFRLGGFPSGTLDGDYRTDTIGTVAPGSATNFGDGFVNFNFIGDPIQAGESSFFFFLKTNATAYDQSGRYDLTSNGQTRLSQSYSTFAPVFATPAVPEPASWGLMLGGFGLVGASLRSRRRRSTVTFA